MDSIDVQLWSGEIGLSMDSQHYWQVLDDNEKKHASTLQNRKILRRYLEVHGQLRLVLGQWLNECPQSLRIARTEHGKPYLVDYPELVFNISHSANTLVMAFAKNCMLGVDIEQCKPRINLLALVNKCFADEEISYWQQLPVTQQLSVFYRLWTRKEAFVKATGRGIALGLKQCVINPENQAEYLRIPEGYGCAKQWLSQDIEINNSLLGALAVGRHSDSNSQAIQIISNKMPVSY